MPGHYTKSICKLELTFQNHAITTAIYPTEVCSGIKDASRLIIVYAITYTSDMRIVHRIRAPSPILVYMKWDTDVGLDRLRASKPSCFGASATSLRVNVC